MSTQQEEPGARRAFGVALALLAAVTLGVAALYTLRGEWFEMPARDFFAANKVRQVTLASTGAEQGLWLSGYPAFASFELPLPLDAHIDSAVLNLEIEASINPDVAADLRISVNDQRVHEEYLDPSRKLLRLTFPLDEALLAAGAGRLRVSFQLRGGRDSDLLCPADVTTGIALRVRSQSFVRMDLEQPVDSVRDTLALMPKRLLVALPVEGNNTGWFEQATALGVSLAHAGYSLRFVPLGPSEELFAQAGREGVVVLGDAARLRTLGYLPAEQSDTTLLQAVLRPGREFIAVTGTDAAALGQVLSPLLRPLLTTGRAQLATVTNARRTMASEVPLSGLGADMSVQQLRSRLDWNLNYSLADLPGGSLPERLHLKFKMPARQDQYHDLLHVELNGQLLASSALRADEVDEVVVELPPALQRLHNRLLVGVQRVQVGSACNSLTIPFPLQLLPESSLVLRQEQGGETQALVDLLAEFQNGFDLRLPPGARGEGSPQALTLLLPVLSEFLAVGQPLPDFLWVSALDDAAPTRPYLALQHVPLATETLIHLEGERLLVAGMTQASSIDGIGKALSLELARSRYPLPPVVATATDAESVVNAALETARPRFGATHGLVLLATAQPPQHFTVDFGRERALLLPDAGAAIEVTEDGSLRNRAVIERNLSSDFDLP